MYKGTIVHEFLHAIGFEHEQNRPDRDTFLKINYSNVIPGYTNNFDKATGFQTFSLAYDYNSIMQYGGDAFSVNGLPTIVPKKTGVKITHPYEKTTFATILTTSDVTAIQKLYKC